MEIGFLCWLSVFVWEFIFQCLYQALVFSKYGFTVD